MALKPVPERKPAPGQQVSDTVEDPFEGGITDVPISAICRNIEIELSQMVGADDLPERLEPVDGVLY